MVTKRLLLFLGVFLLSPFFILTHPVAAQETLQGRYGQDFSRVPFFVRRDFQDETGRSWKDAAISERKDFLNARAEKDADPLNLTEQKLRAIEKAALNAKRAKEREKRAKDREEMRKKRQKAQEKKARRKKLDNLKKSREKTLREFRRKQKSRRR